MKQKDKRENGFPLRIHCEAARQIRQHARSSMKAEVCGVLIGSEDGKATVVKASIPGANAVEAGTHVTFTQDTWEHIYKIKDQQYPDARIVGWYHSHPGFGVFLSDHDSFIHENFFSSPRQVAWVYDPHSDEEGCFGWAGDKGDKIVRLDHILFEDDKGGEGAGETGKAEPLLIETSEDDPEQNISEEPERINPWKLLSQGAKYLAFFMAGVLLCWFLAPFLFSVILVDTQTRRQVLVIPMSPNELKLGSILTPVDMRTGQYMIPVPANPGEANPAASQPNAAKKEKP
ncbi:MAG: Mov34/MPN/PAD-1 family protein [Acidobacteriaceae bacterium]|nr:Mov34/MPN/PAD-1 family protein [Acidobacteriaceae bacterium]